MQHQFPQREAWGMCTVDRIDVGDTKMSMAALASGVEFALPFPMDCHYLHGLKKSDTWCLFICIKIWHHLTCTLSLLLPTDFPQFLIDYTLGPGFRRTNHNSITVHLWPQCRQAAEQTFSVSASPFYLSSPMASIWSQLLAAHPVLYFFSEPGAEIWVSQTFCSIFREAAPLIICPSGHT